MGIQRRGYLVIVGAVAGLGALLTTSLASAETSRGTGGPPSSANADVRAAPGEPQSAVTPQTVAPTPPTLSARPVRVEVDGFFAWAILNRRTQKIAGSANRTATNSTESMIKVWIVADFLRRTAERHQRPSGRRLAQARAAIIDSNDDAAQRLYVAGGRDAVVSRMIGFCGLTDTQIAGPRGVGDRGWWSYTRISARDAVRLGECVKNGTAAGDRWTGWVLEQMSRVRGTTEPADQHPTHGGGRWGIIDGLPTVIRDQGPVGIKNGWTLINADGLWHVNCLAVADDWVLAVLMRYPGKRGLQYGADICSSVAAQLVTPQPSGRRP